MRILAISGSLRAGSTNTALLLAAKLLAPESVTVEISPPLSELPYFNPDLDNENPPESVQKFRKSINNADALLISTPEYAHGIPGLLKNALDWLVSDTEFEGTRIGLLYGSASDASFAKEALLEVLTTMSARVVPAAIVSIAGARSKIAPDGRILDKSVEADLRHAIEALARDYATEA
ncbi:MAG: NAD(P)H-dependent oxidoreductase [Bdellovibrio sp.]|nr:NAD(P)H-dependent oxidoreductase [Bdellovibrio sp.]